MCQSAPVCQEDDVIEEVVHLGQPSQSSAGPDLWGYAQILQNGASNNH